MEGSSGDTVQEAGLMEDGSDGAGPKSVCTGEEVQSAAWTRLSRLSRM